MLAVNRQRLRALLDQVPEPMRGEAKVIHAPAAAVLIEQSADYDLLILATHGRRGFARLFLGSVAEKVVRSSNCPVLVTRIDGAPVPLDGPLVVVLPVDAAHPDVHPLRLVRSWLGGEQRLRPVHVLPPFRQLKQPSVAAPVQEHPHLPWAEGEIHHALTSAGLPDLLVHLEARNTDGNPGAQIADYAREQGAHLVALPTHSRSSLSRLAFGSVAERLARVAPCAVLVLRPPV